MTARRISLVCLLVVVIAAIAVGLVLRHASQDWQQWKQARGIERLDWQGADLGLSQLRLERVIIRQQLGQLKRRGRLEGVTMRWDWRWPLPQLTEVQVQHLELSIEDGGERESGMTDIGALPSIPQQAPAWLPQRLTIDSFEAELPCATGRCSLAGAFRLTRPDDVLPLELALTLNRDSHHLDLSAELSGSTAGPLHLDASIRLDDQTYLTLTSTYRAGPEAPSVTWTGDVEMLALPTADWVMQWLAQWRPLPPLELPPTSSEGSLTGHWRLQAADAGHLLQPETGEAKLQLRLPQPWPVPAVGAVQGTLATTLMARDGQWAPLSLDADLTLSHLADWVRTFPEPLRPQQLAITVSPRNESSDIGDGVLPLTLSVSVEGPTPLTLDTGLLLATEPPWQATLEDSRIQASHRRLVLGSVVLEQLAADLRFSGQIDETGLKWQFAEGSQLQVGTIGGGDGQTAVAAGPGRLMLAGQVLTMGYDLEAGNVTQTALEGPVAITLDQVRYPALETQAWQGHGQMAVDLSRIATTLRLSAATGFGADVSLSYPFGETLVVDARSRLDVSGADEQLAGLFENWPRSLVLDTGQLVAEASLQQGPDRAGVISGHLQFEDLAGVWDRTAFRGLVGSLSGRLEAGELSLGTSDLTLAEVNPGVPIGPIALAWSYQAALGQFLAGHLELDKAVADFLGGQVQVPPGEWQLSQMPIKVPLELERLELSNLIALYPTDGLSGTGTISGRIPVMISRDGLWVEQGRVRALDPGGVLKLPAERIPGLGKGNQAMELIGEALKNFHYSVLNSSVSYDQDGTLHLDLHIEGRNPKVRDGYPVVLNIDLEEDLPALLTSLQLSGRVNELVTERVRELIRKRGGLDN